MSTLRIRDSKKGVREPEALNKETQLHLMATSYPVQGPTGISEINKYNRLILIKEYKAYSGHPMHHSYVH